jgi:acetyl esterase
MTRARAPASSPAQTHQVDVEDIEFGRAGDAPLIARLYRPRGLAGFPAIVEVHGGACLDYVVVCWPISDPLARYRMAKQTGNERLVKNHHAFFADEATMAQASPQAILENGITIKLPPALLIQGTADANVTPDMADKFAAAYAKAGGNITLRKFEGQPHTFASQNPTSPASIEALRLITDSSRARPARWLTLSNAALL